MPTSMTAAPSFTISAVINLGTPVHEREGRKITLIGQEIHPGLVTNPPQHTHTHHLLSQHVFGLWVDFGEYLFILLD